MKKKVIFISAPGTEVGGTLRSTIRLLEGLNTNIEPFVIVGEDGLLKKYCEQNNIKYYLLKYRCDCVCISGNSIKNFFKIIIFPLLRHYIKLLNRKAIKRLNEIVKIEEIDLIHTCHNRVEIGAIVAEKCNIPHIWHIREFEGLDYKLLNVRKNKIKFMNSGLNNNFITISNVVKEHWIKRGLSERNITTIYNGFAINDLKNKKLINKDYKTINAVFVGYLINTKGQDQVVKAIAKLPENVKESFHVDFYGECSKNYYNYLKRLITKYKLEKNITFCGYDIHVEQKLNNYNLAFMCSKSEAFGRVTIDYMLHQVPVIASNTGANPELIKDKVNGLLYEYNNIDDLADQIIYAYNNKKLNDISKKAYKDAIEKYDLNNKCQETYLLYQKILEKNSSNAFH